MIPGFLYCGNGFNICCCAGDVRVTDCSFQPELKSSIQLNLINKQLKPIRIRVYFVLQCLLYLKVQYKDPRVHACSFPCCTNFGGEIKHCAWKSLGYAETQPLVGLPMLSDTQVIPFKLPWSDSLSFHPFNYLSLCLLVSQVIAGETGSLLFVWASITMPPNESVLD